MTVIVPFLDARRYLPRCAESLRCAVERVAGAEVVFVDTSAGGEAVEFLSSVGPRVRVLRCPSANPYRARNLAASEARGEVLAFTDSDCAVDAGWLEIAKTAMAGGADFATGPLCPAAGTSRLLGEVHDYENHRTEAMCRAGGRQVAYAYSNNLAVAASVFRKLGGFADDRARGGDSDLLRRASSADPDATFAFCPGMRVQHLEMASLGGWMRKKFLYGRSGTAALTGLHLPDLAAAAAAGSRRRPGIVAALALGRMAYVAGRWSRLSNAASSTPGENGRRRK